MKIFIGLIFIIIILAEVTGFETREEPAKIITYDMEGCG